MSGCLQLTGSYAAKAAQVDAAYQAALTAAVQQSGSTRLRFVPVLAPPYVPTWPTSGGSSLIAADGVHLTGGPGGGHEALGRRVAADLARAWVAMR